MDREWADQAAKLLSKHFFDYHLNPVELIEKSMNRNQLLGSTFPSLGFSHHPMTLYASDFFNIDLYFWLPSDTLPHDHGFHGAFMPLYGDYAQKIYQFTDEIDLGEGVSRGVLVDGDLIVLENNKAHPIYHAPDFIHEVVHESFCVTIVLRSRNKGEVLSDYFPRLRIKNLHYESMKAEEDWQRLILLEHLAPERLQFQFSEVSSGRLIRWLMREEKSLKLKKLILQEAQMRLELKDII